MTEKKCKHCNKRVSSSHYCTTKNTNIDIDDTDSLILISAISSYMNYDTDTSSHSSNDSSSYDSGSSYDSSSSSFD